MPNTSAGIQAPASALLFEAPASMMPSTWPVPNFCGSFENRFDIAYDIQAAMSAPAPGSAPIAVPSALPRMMDSRSEEHTSELQSQSNLVCRLLLEKKKKK